MESPQNEGIFKVNLPAPGPIPNMIIKKVEDAIYHLFHLKKLDDVYNASCDADGLREFIGKVLETMGVTTTVDTEGLEQIPEKGPVIVVANHPFGGLEGIILGYHLLSVRPDVKIMANYMLSRIPELRELFLFVDPFDKSRDVRSNVKPLRESISWVKGGGLMGIFPAGEVAHMKLNKWMVKDPEWNEVVARIAKRTKATVVPMFFRGRNSLLFQVAGMVHPRLRTAMLPREFTKKSGKDIRLVVGGPILYKRYSLLSETQNITDYFRWRTFLLKRSSAAKRGLKIPFKKLISRGPRQEAIIPETRADLICREIADLPEDQHLITSGDHSVYVAQKHQIPNVMNEIGRLREITFRQVGEGSGQPLDLDRYDEYYHQMILWNNKEQEIMGGYRLGPTDTIMAEHGIKGLYTSTLFRFKKDFFEQVVGLEMGRSFVVEKYQRAYSALLLLWRGIGQMLIRQPKYRYLFGPVSVSNVFRPLSRRVMVHYIEYNHASPLAHLIKPKRPARFLTRKSRLVKAMLERVDDFDEMSDIVTDIEGGGQGAPVLLRQYLKLNSKSCGWNLDPDFGKTLDCFFCSDLLSADQKTLKFYLGKEGLKTYLDYHSNRQQG